MRQLQGFEIQGLFGERDVKLTFDAHSLILVGPNGIGKSSVINIFYFFVSRQWRRLLEYKFERLHLHYEGGVVTADRSDISGLNEFATILNDQKRTPWTLMLEKLISTEQFERFTTMERPTSTERKYFSDLLGIPSSEVSLFQRSLLRRVSIDGTSFVAPRLEIEKRLGDVAPLRVLYLPTYRRIEREIKEVFPDFEDRYRKLVSGDARLEFGRTGNYYVELVSFGMEDVRQTFRNTLQLLKDYSLSQYNNLSASYLRDVIRGQADKYTAKSINSLTDNDVNTILNRVSEDALNREDKTLLRSRIRQIQRQPKASVNVQDKYLAHYFSRLVSITNEIRSREANVSSFVDVCNYYLMPTKIIVYDEIAFTLKIVDARDREIDLSALSSGEKQIVSIFAHLYLEETSNQIVVIDEPELSLSVPWQKRFLSDIMESGRCAFLLAVTHSPFIYDNSLRPCAVDLRRLSVSR